MRLRPTPPKHRGRWRPKPAAASCDRRLTADRRRRIRRPVLRPAVATRVDADSIAAIRQLLFLDREDGALFHLDIPHDAEAAALVREPYIVASGSDAGNPQALIVVDRSIPIVLALIGTPLVFSGR